MYFPGGFINREGEPLPLMIQKSDGGFNYASTGSCLAIRHRIKEEKADWLIYVTDAGQAAHFSMIFKTAELAGYLIWKNTGGSMFLLVWYWILMVKYFYAIW